MKYILSSRQKYFMFAAVSLLCLFLTHLIITLLWVPYKEKISPLGWILIGIGMIIFNIKVSMLSTFLEFGFSSRSLFKDIKKKKKKEYIIETTFKGVLQLFLDGTKIFIFSFLLYAVSSYFISFNIDLIDNFQLTGKRRVAIFLASIFMVLMFAVYLILKLTGYKGVYEQRELAKKNARE